MTSEPQPSPTPEELVEEIERRMGQETWSIPEFLLRGCGLCWMLLGLLVAIFVPLGQLGQALDGPRTKQGPGKETVTILEDRTAVVFDTETWLLFAATLAFLLLSGWGMAKASRWGSIPGCAASVLGILWLCAQAWGNAGPGTWGLVLLVSLLLAVAPVCLWKAWWNLK